MQNVATLASPVSKGYERLKNPTPEEYLKHLMRGAEQLPKILFKTRDDIKSQLSEHGHEIDNVFFKCMTAQSHYIWGDDKKSRLKKSWDQFNLYNEVSQAVKIHNVIPDNMAAPIAVAKMETGTVGYFMEYVDGISLFSLDKDEFRCAAKKLVEAVTKMHDGGSGHGDLRSNIMVTSNNARIKLIDPLRSNSRESDSILMEYDKIVLNDVLRIANSEFVN